MFHISAPFWLSESMSLYLLSAPSTSFFDCKKIYNRKCTSDFVSFSMSSGNVNTPNNSKAKRQQMWMCHDLLHTCKMDPSARSAFEQFSCDFVTSNNLSNAPFVSLMRKYKIPISVSMSILSVVILRKINYRNNLFRTNIFFSFRSFVGWKHNKSTYFMLTVWYSRAFQLLLVDYFQLYKYQPTYDSCLDVCHHEQHDGSSPVWANVEWMLSC